MNRGLSKICQSSKVREKHLHFVTVVDTLNIIADFDWRFQEFMILEPVATFMCFMFGVEVDIDEIAK